MTREQYLLRSLALRSRLAVARIILECDPTPANCRRASEARDRYEDAHTRLFKRFCRPSGRICR